MSTLVTLTVSAVVSLGVAFAWKYGGQWVEAKLANDRLTAQSMADNAKANVDNAGTNKAVATAVQRLTELADQNAEFQLVVAQQHATTAEIAEATKQLMIEARGMMQGAPARGEKTNALLEIIVEEMREQRKNPPALQGTADMTGARPSS